MIFLQQYFPIAIPCNISYYTADYIPTLVQYFPVLHGKSIYSILA